MNFPASLCVLFYIIATLSQINGREINERIIGGATARAGQFPFMAAIYKTTSNGRYFCGGALLSNKWILTAAHCVDEAISFSVILGSTTLSGTDPNRITVSSDAYVIHPDYNKDTLENDVGLIELTDPVLFTDYISSIFLPSADLQPAAKVITVGWGQTDDYTPGPVNHLNFVNVVTLGDAECKGIYGASVIKDNMFCAEGPYNEGTCAGDLGTPLVRYVLNERHAEHVGVATFLSSNGCETTEPSGYTKTFGYLAWIKSVTGL